MANVVLMKIFHAFSIRTDDTQDYITRQDYGHLHIRKTSKNPLFKAPRLRLQLTFLLARKF